MAGKGGARPGAGRPAGAVGGLEGRIAARAHAEEAMKVLVKELKSPEAYVRLAAAKDILDRAWGKPSQAVEVTGKDGNAIQYEDITEARQILESRIAALVAADEAEGAPGTTH